MPGVVHKVNVMQIGSKKNVQIRIEQPKIDVRDLISKIKQENGLSMTTFISIYDNKTNKKLQTGQKVDRDSFINWEKESSVDLSQAKFQTNTHNPQTHFQDGKIDIKTIANQHGEKNVQYVKEHKIHNKTDDQPKPSYMTGNNQARTPVEPGYICNRCKKPGHYIKDCPTNNDKNFDPCNVKGVPTNMQGKNIMDVPSQTFKENRHKVF